MSMRFQKYVIREPFAVYTISIASNNNSDNNVCIESAFCILKVNLRNQAVRNTWTSERILRYPLAIRSYDRLRGRIRHV